MTVVVLGIDALDPGLVDTDLHAHLTLDSHRSIETIPSSTGAPSTHELWPTIITGLSPAEHGLVVDDGVAWDSPALTAGSVGAKYLLPNWIRTKIGNWLLNNTEADAFQIPATYYADGDLETVFDKCESAAIGIPNYVVDPDIKDREQQLRSRLGDLFKRDTEEAGDHTSSDPAAFYEQCLEMVMIRIARVRRALRSREHELVFGYTSGLDLIGHVTRMRPALQNRAYGEINEFVSELRGDLAEEDELILLSDHGLRNGLHTDEAMISATDPIVIDNVESVLDVRAAIEELLRTGEHRTKSRNERRDRLKSKVVQEQLNNLGYF